MTDHEDGLDLVAELRAAHGGAGLGIDRVHEAHQHVVDVARAALVAVDDVVDHAVDAIHRAPEAQVAGERPGQGRIDQREHALEGDRQGELERAAHGLGVRVERGAEERLAGDAEGDVDHVVVEVALELAGLRVPAPQERLGVGDDQRHEAEGVGVVELGLHEPPLASPEVALAVDEAPAEHRDELVVARPLG